MRVAYIQNIGTVLLEVMGRNEDFNEKNIMETKMAVHF